MRKEPVDGRGEEMCRVAVRQETSVRGSDAKLTANDQRTWMRGNMPRRAGAEGLENCGFRAGTPSAERVEPGPPTAPQKEEISCAHRRRAGDGPRGSR